MWSCDKVTQINEIEEKTLSKKSEIDGKPIVVISAADYYQAQSDYMNEAIDRVSENGSAIVEAVNTQIKAKVGNNEKEKVTSDAVIVGLSELESTSAYKSKEKDDSNSLADVSSHIRIMERNGDYEEFELVLQPHNNLSARAKTGDNALLSTQNTWLALSPDRFYFQEDDRGIEILPITFPAVSIDNPDHEIEVTLEKDGNITWPEKVKSKSNTESSSGVQNEMVYLENVASIVEPCDTCDGGGGGGSSGGRFENSSVESAPFLALKTIRLGSTDGDMDNALELQMIVEAYPGYNDKFNREWNYVFDHKRGMTNRPLWFDDFRLWSILSNTYKLHTDIKGALKESASSVFSGRNTRTFAGDSRIYQTPDVNYSNNDYNFTNMRAWTYFYAGSTFENGYAEGPRLDYFPLVMLNQYSYRIVLMEDDKKYPYASRRRDNTLERDIWTFNMGNGSYDELHTIVDANNHTYGNSDDILKHSGVRNITEGNVNERLEGRSSLKAQSSSGFKYVFKKIYRTSEFRPKD